MKDIPLHDIKPLVEVPDNSLVYLIVLLVLSVAVLAVLAFWIWRHLSRPKEEDLRKYYLQQLHAVDLEDTKQAAYAISEYGRHVAQGERALEMLATLDSRLQQYKYKKEVASLDDETRGYYQLFLEVVDAS